MTIEQYVRITQYLLREIHIAKSHIIDVNRPDCYDLLTRVSTIAQIELTALS